MRSRVDPRVGCGGRYRSFPENAAWHPCLARMARRLRLMSLHMRHMTHVGEGRAKRRGARTGPREARPHSHSESMQLQAPIGEGDAPPQKMSTKNNSTAEQLCVQCCPVRSGVRRAPRPTPCAMRRRGGGRGGAGGGYCTLGRQTEARKTQNLSHVRYRTTVPAVPGDRTQRRDFRSPVNVAPRSRDSPQKGPKIQYPKLLYRGKRTNSEYFRGAPRRRARGRIPTLYPCPPPEVDRTYRRVSRKYSHQNPKTKTISSPRVPVSHTAYRLPGANSIETRLCAPRTHFHVW